MSQSSTILTIGTALRRAEGQEVTVWTAFRAFTGRVAAVDGHGVIIADADAGRYHVIRLDAVDGVTLTPATAGLPQIQPPAF